MNGNISQLFTTIRFAPSLDEIVRRDRHEQRVADRLDHDVHEANGHVPEQHGQRSDAKLDAQGLRIGKKEEAYEKGETAINPAMANS